MLYVLNNFIRKRVTAKSSKCSSAFVRRQISRPYKKTGIHFVETRCRTTYSNDYSNFTKYSSNRLIDILVRAFILYVTCDVHAQVPVSHKSGNERTIKELGYLKHNENC